MADILGRIVDELGELKAEISKLVEKEKQLKSLLIQSNQKEINGDLFRVTVSVTDRESLDSELVRQYLTHEEIQECTKISQVVTVRVGARKN